jgi:hypothetical protein
MAAVAMVATRAVAIRTAAPAAMERGVVAVNDGSSYVEDRGEIEDPSDIEFWPSILLSMRS